MRLLTTIPAGTHEIAFESFVFALKLMLSAETGAGACPLEEAHFKRYCRHALEQQNLKALSEVDQLEVSVQLLDVESASRLNSQYRQKPAATNVLSFESDMPALSADHGETLLMLGDLVFCPPVIEREAQAQGKSLEQHWIHLLVHGTLHLCGYEHEEAGEAALMEELEIRILSQVGVPDPYQMQAVQ